MVQSLASSVAYTEGPAVEPKMEMETETEIEEITVFGLRTGLLDDDVSAFSTRIDVDPLEGNPRSLADVLSETVGVQIRRFGGPGDPAEVSIRGFTPSQVVVTLDGVRLNSARGGGVNINNIPIQLLEEVDVSRGGGAVQAGSGAMGGVVALRTRRPGGEPEARGSLSYGSFETWDGSIYAGAPSSIVDWGLGYNGFKSDGDFVFRPPIIDNGGVPILPPEETVTRINNRSERHALTGNFGHDFEGVGYLQLFQTLGYTSAGQPGPALITNDRESGQNPSAHLREFNSITQLRLEDVDMGVGGGTLRSGLFYRYKRSHFKDPIVHHDEDDPIDTRFDESSAGLSLEPRWEGRGYGISHRVGTAFGAQRESLNSTTQPFVDRYGVHLAVQDDAALLDDRIRIVPALRFDWTDDFGDEWLPSLGVVRVARPLATPEGKRRALVSRPELRGALPPGPGLHPGQSKPRAGGGAERRRRHRAALRRLGPDTRPSLRSRLLPQQDGGIHRLGGRQRDDDRAEEYP